MVLQKNIIYLLLLFSSLVVSAQAIPPIQIFNPQDYGAEDQNWSISQSSNNLIYVANNKGLLEYNGASWKLYNSPNDAILRSVHVVGDRIYSGGYMDFGYWIKNNRGSLEYVSMCKNQKFSIQEDEDFWGIVDVEGYVLFQSFERIYILNTKDQSFNIIESDERINKMFKVDDVIYFQKTDNGIFKLENGNPILVIPSDNISNNEIVNIYNFNAGLLLQTKEHGFYTFENSEIELWNISSNESISKLSVYSSTRLNDGSFILGTISNGIVQLDKNGNEILRIDQSDGLGNNTVLSVMEDKTGNIWLGLDNGINIININSPFKVYTDKQGVLGTVYAAAVSDNFLYLGTNQGLFYKPLNSKKAFSFIEGTKGQVWTLRTIDGALFCGHDKGTFIINETNAELISKVMGTWAIKEIVGHPDILIQGNYRGLNILEKVNNTWQYRNRIEGFNISSRYFEFIGPNELLISHELKGIYKIKTDENFDKIIADKKIDIQVGVKSSIVSYDNNILYSSKDGVFRYSINNELFKKDTILSELLGGDKYVSGKLFYDEVGKRLWGFSKNEIIYLEPGKLSKEPKINTIAISSEVRKSKATFENILNLNNDSYLMGTTEGYLIMDINKLEKNASDIHLNSVAYRFLNADPIYLALDSTATLENKTNSVHFEYSVANYDKFTTLKYQYRLIGKNDDWSDWSEKSNVFFENLPYGDYTFEARAKTDGILNSNELSYSFVIDKPWYLKPLAIAAYFVLGLLLIYVLHYFNKRHYKKQQQKILEKQERELKLEQLENQRQLNHITNENLRIDIESKNRELGMATMNLVKRNELLNNIKVELTKSKSLNENKGVIKLINSSLNNTSDWKLFEEAFNNVDKDFMKRIKSIHPSITPNDLRLCAYLRLNLSSKEIAPLLNISHKSVEVKRYRLRKKIGLDHEQSLSNYIIEL